MRFTVLVHAAPYSSEAAHSAYRFTRAALAGGHSVHRLFFFGDGVHNAARLAQVPQGEKNLQQQWQELISQHGLDALLCVTSAMKRGIVDPAEAKRRQTDEVTASTGMEIAGLGQLIDAVSNSDRVINFG